MEFHIWFSQKRNTYSQIAAKTGYFNLLESIHNYEF
jgi:hypothetical protein